MPTSLSRPTALDAPQVLLLAAGYASHIGKAVGYQGKYDAAEAMHRGALKGREKELGHGYPSMLSSMRSLAEGGHGMAWPESGNVLSNLSRMGNWTQRSAGRPPTPGRIERYSQGCSYPFRILDMGKPYHCWAWRRERYFLTSFLTLTCHLHKNDLILTRFLV
jgi:hypothetical protein